MNRIDIALNPARSHGAPHAAEEISMHHSEKLEQKRFDERRFAPARGLEEVVRGMLAARAALRTMRAMFNPVRPLAIAGTRARHDVKITAGLGVTSALGSIGCIATGTLGFPAATFPLIAVCIVSVLVLTWHLVDRPA